MTNVQPEPAGADVKVVVITGGSGGIGAALARVLADRGHAIVLAARRGAELRRMAEEVAGRGAAGAIAVETDVTRREDVFRLRDAALAEFGTIDVWVNNAGRGISRPVLELTEGDVDAIVAVNLKSALYGMQAAVPYFEARGRGHLVNVSSFLGRVPMAAHRSVYAAAKAALNSLTSNLRVGLRARGSAVEVTLVMPGLVTTDFARNAIAGGPPSAVPSWVSALPEGAMRPQTPEEVAEIIAGAIARPVPELYTNPAAPGLVREYYADVAAFEGKLAGG
jgi:NAD(P)-dependent dehydrogenase (short-subunit alcohol dehydrogenase family)